MTLVPPIAELLPVFAVVILMSTVWALIREFAD